MSDISFQFLKTTLIKTVHNLIISSAIYIHINGFIYL